MRRTPPAALVAAAALALAGCGGGSQSDEATIRTIVNDYFDAFADRDGERACAELGAATQQQIEKAAKAKDCASALEAAAERPDVKRYLDKLHDVEILDVDITGSEATAKVRAIGQQTTMPLKKENGTWKIEASDLAPGS